MVSLLALELLAIKKLDMSTTTMLHTDEAFLKLVSTVSKLNHENITKLVGYSVEHGQRILVYEYCTNGTLHDALHLVDEDNKILPWNARIKLALGVAQALEYMHEVCQPPLVHQNLKSANVLLDDEFSARLSDCGLDSIYTGSCASQVSSQMLGSFSYGAPEYTMSGVYNIQSDIYSFGVVMLVESPWTEKEMRLVEKLAWANEQSKRCCRRLYWRVRAEIRKAVKSMMNERRLMFRYDASSYALNFDDGDASSSGYLDDALIFVLWLIHFIYKAKMQNLMEISEGGAEM